MEGTTTQLLSKDINIDSRCFHKTQNNLSMYVCNVENFFIGWVFV